MEITGLCKEEFEKFRLLNYEETEAEPRGSGDTIWNYVGESMQYGVLVDYFDSVGIYIGNSRIAFAIFQDEEKNIHVKCKTRPEARTQAIEKANELRNNQLKE